MPPLIIAGLALAAAKVVKGIVDKNKADKIAADFTPYKVSPYAEAQLGNARQMMNARMAGAATEERNIDTSQASYNHFIDNNATNGAQALALAGQGQGRANEAYSNLAIKEQQNKYGLLSNLNMAYQAMTNENDKVYQSKLNKYYMDVNQKRALNASGDQNIFGGISDGISMGMMGGGNTPVETNNMHGSMVDAPLINNTNFAGPANTFGGSMPQAGSFQLWYPPMKQAG